MEKNEEQKLREMINTYQTELLHFCYIRLQDKMMAEDAVQETFLKVYRHLSGYKDEGHEKAWLYRIALNVCRDMLRSGWFRRINRHITPELLPDDSTPPNEEEIALSQAIHHLPVKSREVILLHYYQGFSVTETASILGIRQSSTSERLQRAREQLKTMLKGEFEDE
ncbi:MAG: RNA polymerase sigma factor [Clostridia bacterium]|nr:RNA polymerase sigma factor [Clostridia bacterium]